MRSIPTKLSVLALAIEIQQIDDFWRDGSGAYMAIRPCHGVPEWLNKCPTIIEALKEISLLRNQDVLHVMINKMPPGVAVPIHTDTLAPTQQGPTPRVERWHLPVQTNRSCLLWDEDNGITHMALGSWWGPVPYWVQHSVRNDGITERVHIVVDLDTPERLDETVRSGCVGDPGAWGNHPYSG